jgi:hypothetical protein
MTMMGGGVALADDDSGDGVDAVDEQLVLVDVNVGCCCCCCGGGGGSVSLHGSLVESLAIGIDDENNAVDLEPGDETGVLALMPIACGCDWAGSSVNRRMACWCSESCCATCSVNLLVVTVAAAAAAAAVACACCGVTSLLLLVAV